MHLIGGFESVLEISQKCHLFPAHCQVAVRDWSLCLANLESVYECEEQCLLHLVGVFALRAILTANVQLVAAAVDSSSTREKLLLS